MSAFAAQTLLLGWAIALHILPGGAISVIAGAMPTITAPNGKVALAIFLPLFGWFEYLGITKAGPPMTQDDWICRIISTAFLVIGMILGALTKRDENGMIVTDG